MKPHHRPEHMSFSDKEVSSCRCKFTVPVTPESVLQYEASKEKSFQKPQDAPSAMDILKRHQRL